jgi:hypothetical protein
LWALPIAHSRRREWTAKRKDGKKTSAAKQRRQQQLAEGHAELDRLVAEFHALLPRSEASLLQLLGELFRDQNLADLPVGSLITPQSRHF